MTAVNTLSSISGDNSDEWFWRENEENPESYGCIYNKTKEIFWSARYKKGVPCSVTRIKFQKYKPISETEVATKFLLLKYEHNPNFKDKTWK